MHVNKTKDEDEAAMLLAAAPSLTCPLVCGLFVYKEILQEDVFALRDRFDPVGDVQRLHNRSVGPLPLQLSCADVSRHAVLEL